ncbi:hypothetical protein HY439_03125 [Candidatus Microgenomates bacterium]|nr:hypothetical protein [Candidatus Microgenomates bacterium]
MSYSNPDYKNVTASVRTPKVVTFISTSDKHWKHTVMRIIEWYSKMWGGAYNLIIPTDGTTIDKDFWQILERYSPDYLVSYYYTFAGLSLADPKAYERGIKNRYSQLEKAFPDMTEDSIKEHVNQEAEMSVYHKFNFTDQLQQELKQRLSPFYFEDHIVREKVTWNSKVTFPLTPIEKIIPHSDINNIFSVNLPKKYQNSDLKLIVYSVSGFATNEYLKELEKIGVTIDYVPNSYPIKSILEDVVKGGVDLSSQKLERELSETLNNKAKKEWMPETDYLRQSPFSVSMLKLGRYHKVTEHRDWEEPVVLVVGDTIQDFCYYYSLSKAHGDFYWMPKSLLDKFDRALSKKIKANKYLTELEAVPYAIVNVLYSKIGYGYDDKKILLTSRSLLNQELDRLRDILIKAINSGNFSKSIEVANGQDFTKCMLNVIEQDNYTNQQTQTFVDGQSIGRIETPKPKNFKYIDPREHRWITEISIDGYKLPQLHFLGHQAIPISNAHDVRISSEGISYFCPNISYFGGDIDVVLMKPKLNLIEPIEIFREYYKEAGYKQVSISDKGQLSQRAIAKFGSLDRVGVFLIPEKNRNLIEKFIKAPPTADESTGEEIVFVNQRNYLNFKSIAITLGDEKEAISLIDEFILKEIFHKGFIFHCEACLKSDWYGVESITSKFKCSRCGHEQTYSHKHWKSPQEPSWYYKLDEVIREGFVQNMTVPLLTLYFLKRKSPESFLYVPELGLWKDNVEKNRPDLEIDINCIADGKIIVGEAKTNNISKEDINIYAAFVKLLKKYPDEVVFSTLNNDWSSDIKSEIQKIDKTKTIFNKDLLSA